MPGRLLVLVVAFMVAMGLCTDAAPAREAGPPREVRVLPVFLVPQGEAAPTEDQIRRLLRHLAWARTRYSELLPHHATFAIAEGRPLVYRSHSGLAFYRGQREEGAPHMVSHLLAELKCSRVNCPYVLLVVVMNARDPYPAGGGRSLNGGFDTGAGFLMISSFNLDHSPNFQTTLQHELGHAFGLPHVDAYGYDMQSNDSIMSYNPRHHTKGFTPSMTPGRLIPEDVRGLALNQRAFPGLRFDPKKDVPRGYVLGPIRTIGPMVIPGQP